MILRFDTRSILLYQDIQGLSLTAMIKNIREKSNLAYKINLEHPFGMEDFIA